MQKPSTAIVWIIIFSLLEAFVLRVGFAASIAAAKPPFITNDLILNLIAILIGLAVGLGVGYLIFRGLKVNIWVKLSVAVIILVVSAMASTTIGMDIARQQFK